MECESKTHNAPFMLGFNEDGNWPRGSPSCCSEEITPALVFVQDLREQRLYRYVQLIVLSRVSLWKRNIFCTD
jgi:hypothetical protein